MLPRTLGELQLYRILQRANLLQYYEAFIQQGGDDVQQLCEAAEDEFLEIMALVGMASKPLHVRRLQKALRDWVTNPAVFNQPISSLPVCSIPVYKMTDGSPPAARGRDLGRADRAAAPPGASSPSQSASDTQEAARGLFTVWFGRGLPPPPVCQVGSGPVPTVKPPPSVCQVGSGPVPTVNPPCLRVTPAPRRRSGTNGSRRRFWTRWRCGRCRSVWSGWRRRCPGPTRLR